MSASVDLDGTGVHDVQTGIGFLDHMLEQLARHNLIDLHGAGQGRPAHRFFALPAGSVREWNQWTGRLIFYSWGKRRICAEHHGEGIRVEKY